MGSKIGVSRRRFMRDSVVVATTWELQRAAFAMGFGASVPVCRLAAEQEVGPYYVPDEMVRRDIREAKPGLPLTLQLALLDVRTCKPLTGAAVDLWHCDALGLYAGFTKQNPMGPGGFGGPGGPGGFSGPPPNGFDPEHPGNRPGPPEGFGPPAVNHPTDELTFLRGIQRTGPDGKVMFETVFPGFYMGRTNHIHFKVRLEGQLVPETTPHRQGQTYQGGHTAHTGQVFFPEEMTAELMRHEPYSRHTIHRTTQAEDHVFTEQHGALFIATVRPVQAAGGGYRAQLAAAVDPTATPAGVGPGGDPHQGPRRPRETSGTGGQPT